MVTPLSVLPSLYITPPPVVVSVPPVIVLAPAPARLTVEPEPVERMVPPVLVMPAREVEGAAVGGLERAAVGRGVARVDVQGRLWLALMMPLLFSAKP